MGPSSLMYGSVGTSGRVRPAAVMTAKALGGCPTSRVPAARSEGVVVRMTTFDQGLMTLLAERGVSRRAFLKFSATMAGVLALPPSYAPKIAAALSSSARIPVIWLEGQDC